MFRNREWLAPSIAAVAFSAALLAFVFLISRYFGTVREWSQADLESRARLAASAIDEPLKTLDFKSIESTAARLSDEGLRLRIVAGGDFRVPQADCSPGGFFDSEKGACPAASSFQWGVARTGDFAVGVGRPSAETMRPFYRALSIAALAALAGVFAMGFVFFALYRQRVRIAELARLESFRREFIADVSHEIRTPLTGILGAADMLEDCVDGKSAPLIGLLRGSVGRLTSLMQQILDLSRMERSVNAGALNLREVDVADLARGVAASSAVSFRRGSGDCIALCDAQLLSQALENLVENAKRHSGSDEIFLECSSLGDEIVLAVEDRGVGVSQEYAERIFERFFRVDPSRAAETGGAGLGLAIVRRIAELHGGGARYLPAQPRGSRFVITLPRRKK